MVYLGTDLPAEEIAAGVMASGASVVVLSLVYPVADPRLVEEVRRLRGLVGGGVRIVAGGRAVSGLQEELKATGVDAVGGLDGLSELLRGG